jgi:hypothetical protein
MLEKNPKRPISHSLNAHNCGIIQHVKDFKRKIALLCYKNISNNPVFTCDTLKSTLHCLFLNDGYEVQADKNNQYNMEFQITSSQ